MLRQGVRGARLAHLFGWRVPRRSKGCITNLYEQQVFELLGRRENLETFGSILP
jgi:hypothetical protein